MLQAVARAASIEQLATSQPDRSRTVAFNFKVAPWCDRDAHDGTRQIGAVHLVNGAVRVVHQKGLEDPTGLCRAVNSIESARAVTGADKCGLLRAVTGARGV